MKKAAFAEVEKQQSTELSELLRRLSAIEQRLEKLDPPKQTLEPYPVLSQVYSVQDLEGRNPFTVIGYLGRRILVRLSPGEPARSLPLESVRRLEECPRAQPTPSQLFAGVKCPKARAEMEGRRQAKIDAITRPFAPPIPHQERYGKTGTFTGGRLVYDE